VRLPAGRTLLLTLATLLLAAALVGAGRLTADSSSARASGYRDGLDDGHYAGYFDGLNDGESQGLREGRTLQVADALPARSRHLARRAFSAGYIAGADDVFAGYDGGWALGTPYIVVLEHGGGRQDYRISTRTALKPGVAYALCGDGTGICEHPLP
jgi:hypothetical protein